MIALVTAFLGGLTFWNGASSGGANGLLEMLLGVFLIALAIGVAAFCIVPEKARDLVLRLRPRNRASVDPPTRRR